MKIDLRVFNERISLENIKKEFPILNKDDRGKKLIYLDSAATSQKPQVVIDSIKSTYENSYANVHRGIYNLSQVATEKYENAREKVAKFLGAADSSQIVFTRGATEGLNLIAHSLAELILNKDDEILISTLEHHSNIIPWQTASKRRGAKLVEIIPSKEGEISADLVKKLFTSKTKILALPHVTNSIGSVIPVKEICADAKKRGIVTVIDGCQAAPHIKIDLNNIGADFYVISGHKIYGPSGIGALYGRKEILEKLTPYQTGGEMIDYVSIQNSTFAEAPHKFEAGTPNIVGAIALGTAIDFINDIGYDNITSHSKYLTDYFLKGIKEVKGVKIIGNPEERISIISFIIEGTHPHDLALLLDNKGIAVRAGHHCAQPAMRHFKVDTTLRVSFGIYNTEKDIDLFLEKLKGLQKYFD